MARVARMQHILDTVAKIIGWVDWFMHGQSKVVGPA
jgi:hypothetical protein